MMCHRELEVAAVVPCISYYYILSDTHLQPSISRPGLEKETTMITRAAGGYVLLVFSSRSELAHGLVSIFYCHFLES